MTIELDEDQNNSSVIPVRKPAETMPCMDIVLTDGTRVDELKQQAKLRAQRISGPGSKIVSNHTLPAIPESAGHDTIPEMPAISRPPYHDTIPEMPAISPPLYHDTVPATPRSPNNDTLPAISQSSRYETTPEMPAVSLEKVAIYEKQIEGQKDLIRLLIDLEIIGSNSEDDPKVERVLPNGSNITINIGPTDHVTISYDHFIDDGDGNIGWRTSTYFFSVATYDFVDRHFWDEWQGEVIPSEDSVTPPLWACAIQKPTHSGINGTIL